MTKVSNCEQVREFLLSGDGDPPAGVRDHARACEPCAALLADGAVIGRALAPALAPPGPVDLAPLRAQLTGALARERGVAARLRSTPTHLRLALAVGLGLAVLAFILLVKARADLGVYPLSRLIPTVVVYAALAFFASRLALWPLQRPLPPRWLRVAVAFAALVLPLIIAGLPAAHDAHAHSVGGAGADLVPRALACFSFGTLLSAPVLALVWLASRAPRQVSTLLPLCGVASGLVGTAALELHCPLTAPAHLLVGHATVAVVFVAALAGVSALRSARS